MMLRCVSHAQFKNCVRCRPDILLRWWEAADNKACAFGGHRWWVVPGAATGSSIEAQTWRQLRSAGSAERDVYAELLCGALLLPQGGNVAALLAQLRESLGASWAELLRYETDTGSNETPEDGSDSYSSALRALRVALFAFAAHVQAAAATADAQAAAATDGAEPARVPDAARAADCALRALEHLCGPLVEELTAPKGQGVLVGGAEMQAATLLLAHELNMAAGMLIVWEDALRLRASDRHAISSTVCSLAGAVDSTCRELQAACTTAAAALRGTKDDVQTRVGVNETRMQPLLKCSDAANVQQRLQRVVDAQRIQLEWLAGDVCGRILQEIGVVREHMPKPVLA